MRNELGGKGDDELQLPMYFSIPIVADVGFDLARNDPWLAISVFHSNDYSKTSTLR